MTRVTDYTPVRTNYANVQDDPDVPAITGPELEGRDTQLTDLTTAVNGLGTAADHPATDFDTAGSATDAQAASLQISENLADLADAATARTNLGLGTAATQDTSAFDAAGAAAAAQAAAENHADTAVAAVVNSAPSTLDTLKELADALGDDQNYAATTTAALAARLQKTANLSDVSSVSTARTNLGLGDAATHAATDFDAAGTAASAVAAVTAAVAQLKGTVVYVEDFGAVGDGTTDDTAHIQTAINTAVATCVTAGTNYAEVRFRATQYACNGALQQGGTTKANAVITLPIIPMTSNCVTLVLKGAGEASALPIWLQTTPQKNCTVISTTTAGTNHATFGEAALIGGPNVKQYGAGNTWNNMQVVVDGIQLLLPTDPHICGFDFDATAQVIIKSAAVYTNTGVTTTVVPTQTWQFGVRMPNSDNQSLEVIDRLSIEGCFFGLDMAEHTIVSHLYVLYCNIGINCVSQNATPHTSMILYANVEWCIWAAIQTSASSGSFKLQVLCLDIEIGGSTNPSGFNGPSKVIDDTGNKAWGFLGIRSASDPLVSTSRVIGGANLEIIDYGRKTGTFAAPSVPASGSALVGAYRNAAVYVAGGTVSAIAVDGSSLGITSGLVMVPSGKSITLTYSVAPTWTWTLL